MRGNKAKFFIEVIIHVLFWLGIYYAMKALTTSSFQILVTHNNGPTQSMNGHTMFRYAWIVLGVLMLLFYGNILWLFKKVIRLKSKVQGVTLIIGWWMLLFAINYGVIRLVADSSGSESHPHAGSPGPQGTVFSADDWMSMQGVMVALFLSVLGIAAAYFFIREWIRNDLKRSQAEAHQLSTEIRFLRSQVNPHFLFNTLNNLFSMAQKRGNDELADGVSKLSGMMRYMIYESNTESVALQKEIEYLEDCIALNKLRYAGSEVSVSFRYPEPAAIADVPVAPMLFIPFLENAFKHGISIGHHSRIDLAISINQKKLTFTCENTDHSAVKKLAEEKGGIGLENVQRRLELVYPGRHVLRTEQTDKKYSINLQIELA
ncbi:MAG TPA: histidine kinase [Puia sp.]